MDIVKLIGDRLHLIKNGKKFKAACPFHTDPLKVITMLIDPDKQTYTCLKCGAHGGPDDFYRKYEGEEPSTS